MIRRSTWIVLILFIIVLAAAWYLNRNPISKDEQATTTTPGENLFSLGSAKISELSLERKDGSKIRLSIKEDGTWQLMLPTEEPADGAAVNSNISQLQNAEILSRLNPVPSEADMGLDDPEYIIVLLTDSGQQMMLQVGDETPTKSGYYVRLNNDIPVVVAKFNLSSTLAMVEKLPVAPTPIPTNSNN